MEIRTLEAIERESLLELLESWEPPDDRHRRDVFRRRFGTDASVQEKNVWVAADRGELLGCVQIFPRRLRILGHGIPGGGLGSLFVRPEYRGQGIGGSLVERAATAMRERGMELSVLFASRRGLFQRLGWNSWKGQRSILRRVGHGAPVASGGEDPSSVEIVSFDRRRDRALAAVKAIHSAYSGSRNGTVIRDEGLWEASLELASNPVEEFLVARRGGLAVAYARAALLEEGLTVAELGRFEDGSFALARLLVRLLEPREGDPLAPAGRSSEEVRSFAVLPTFDDIALTVSLDHEGVASHPLDDESGMIRCLNLAALAARLDVELLPVEDEASFLRRILPPDGFVFWPADRF